MRLNKIIDFQAYKINGIIKEVSSNIHPQPDRRPSVNLDKMAQFLDMLRLGRISMLIDKEEDF